jgi:hypothetical protein
LTGDEQPLCMIAPAAGSIVSEFARMTSGYGYSPHNREVAGSSPAPATDSKPPVTPGVFAWACNAERNPLPLETRA